MPNYDNCLIFRRSDNFPSEFVYHMTTFPILPLKDHEIKVEYKYLIISLAKLRTLLNENQENFDIIKIEIFIEKAMKKVNKEKVAMLILRKRKDLLLSMIPKFVMIHILSYLLPFENLFPMFIMENNTKRKFPDSNKCSNLKKHRKN